MYLLYLDEAGTHSDARHFVLAGVAVYEHNAYWPTEALNRLQAQYFPNVRESVRFHASPLRAPATQRVDAPFDRLSPSSRRKLLAGLYEAAQQTRGRLFAVIIEKTALSDEENPYERSLEEMIARFDLYLNRLYRERQQRNKGLIVIADSQDKNRLEAVSRRFAAEGTRWNKIYNVLDIPLFTLSQNSRLLQIADLIANMVYGRYERGYSKDFDLMTHKFDQTRNGPIHGLVHIRPSMASQCYLPCCLSRRPHSQSDPGDTPCPGNTPSDAANGTATDGVA